VILLGIAPETPEDVNRFWEKPAPALAFALPPKSWVLSVVRRKETRPARDFEPPIAGKCAKAKAVGG